MKIHVEVTEEDILNGKPNNYVACPVALALKRASPDAEPDVEQYTAGVQGASGPHGELPEEVSYFIESFDAGHPVEPIAFDLEIPD